MEFDGKSVTMIKEVTRSLPMWNGIDFCSYMQDLLVKAIHLGDLKSYLHTFG